MAGKPGMHRARTSAGETESAAITGGLESGEPRDPNKGVKRKRIGMGQGANLAIYGAELDHDNYYYRWIEESSTNGGRLERAYEAGYEHHTNSAGEKFSRRSGPGLLYLMRLPKEFREEDLAAKRKRSQMTMDEQTRLGRNEYAPDSRGRPEGGTSSIQEHRLSKNPFA